MTEEHSSPALGNLAPVDAAERQAARAEVQALDPELLAHPVTAQLIELGLRYGEEVTAKYGTPAHPRWVSGLYEQSVFMSYHNGGTDGHTSVGPDSAGVPRNVLLIANAVNTAAGREVFDPMMRAVAFYAAGAHDIHLLGGRTLLPEGQGEGHGDEQLSAEDARERYMAYAGDSEIAEQAFHTVMATAFNPLTNTQNVSYQQWRENPNDSTVVHAVLNQELIAAADLLTQTGPRGPLSAIEYTVESFCLIQNGRLIQNRFREDGIDPASIDNMEAMMALIGRDEILLKAFIRAAQELPLFLADHLHYSDEAIRAACGKGIDDLFPGRAQNATILGQYAGASQAGEVPVVIWQQARSLVVAGN